MRRVRPCPFPGVGWKRHARSLGPVAAGDSGRPGGGGGGGGCL